MEYVVVVEMILNCGLFLLGESSLLGQHYDGDPVFIQRSLRGHNEVARGIGNTQRMKSLHGYRNNAQSLTRLAEFPACDGDHAFGLEMLEIFPEGLHGVKIVFAERESSGGSRSPRVDQRHLHDIELLWARSQVRAAIGHVNVNF